MTKRTGIQIILIEDNVHDAEMTMRTLQKHNLANPVIWLRDGEAAMEYLFGNGGAKTAAASQTPGLILLDLKLPKIDGLEILSRLKQDETTHMIPVIILTSSGEERDIVESYRLGVNSYVVKPVKFENFAEAVLQLGMYWLILNQHPEQSREDKNR